LNQAVTVHIYTYFIQERFEKSLDLAKNTGNIDMQVDNNTGG